MINMRKFYLIAGILMGISVLGQIWNLYLTWGLITTGAKVSGIAGGVLFNLLLTILFFGFYKLTPDMNLNSSEHFDKIIDNKDLDKLLKELTDK